MAHFNGDLDNKGNTMSAAAAHDAVQKKTQRSLPKEILHAALKEKCDWMIQQPVDKYRNLFSRQSFLLVGFDEDNDSVTDNGDREVPVDSSRLPSKKQNGFDPVDFSDCGFVDTLLDMASDVT
mmetsp:Transcript_30251/g.64107  ORF Transcript_30251/g.64107 Transcript_30251/m.64107 type:complete len:123 (+) Transcript_30251:515-883(+)